MKRILLLALPWMAMATVATGQVRQAHVTYSFLGTLKSPAYRVADECFLPISCLKEIGWTADMVDGMAQVTADGSHITRPTRNIIGKESIPLCRAIEMLGGEATWSEREPDRLSIVSVIQSITLVNGRLKIDASLNVRALISKEEDPNRVVVDFPGAKLKKTGVFELDSKSRLAQYKADQVRIVWEGDESPNTATSFGPAKGLDVPLFSPKRRDPSPLPSTPSRHDPLERPDPIPTPAPGNQNHGVQSQSQSGGQGSGSNQGNQSSQGSTGDDGSGGGLPGPGETVKLPIPIVHPSGNSSNSSGGLTNPLPPTGQAVPLKPAVPVGPPQLTVESQDSLTLSMALASPLANPPRVARPDPTTIVITLPNADLKVSPDFKLDTESVTSVKTAKDGSNSLLTLNCARPMGAEVVTNGTMVQIHLLKPKVGNGKLAGKTIVIDPGHGGRDTGCFSPDRTVFEKDLTLSIGKLVAHRLAEDGATVILTRQTDYLTPLEERPRIANRNNADFFVSIHINSLSIDNKVSGTRTYYHANNRISQLLGYCLQNEIVKVSGLPSQGVQSDTSLYSSGKGLAVLRGTDKTMPAVLIEVGFINHDIDRAAMVQPEFQLSFALAVERGLKVYLGDVKTKD